MHIMVDAREAEKLNPTGKGVWAKNVIYELEKRNVELSRIGNPSSIWHLKTAKFLKNNVPDIYLSTTSFIVPYLLGKKVPYAIVVHDLIAFEKDRHDKKAKLIERFTLKRAARNAKIIFTVSDSTRLEFLKRFPDIDPNKVVTVYAGPTITDLEQAERSEGNYILSIGTLCPRKNQLKLIEAWNLLPTDIKTNYKLILAGGRGWDDDEIVELAEKSDGVEWKGFVESKEMIKLLSDATAFAYPSLLEGFGIPILDAMKLAIPVITSNRSSLREISGNANLLIDPEDTRNITEALEKVLTDPVLRKDLSEKGIERSKCFSWEKTADLIVENLKMSDY